MTNDLIEWEGPQHEITHAALHIGLFDLATIILGCIGLALVFGGFFAFFDFRRSSNAAAKKEAQRVARITAEEIANEYLQKELPAIIEEYRDLYGDVLPDGDEDADEYSIAQEEPQ